MTRHERGMFLLFVILQALALAALLAGALSLFDFPKPPS